ncbi:S8 family serine peptidase [Methanoculleus bourgensis]|uniref:S8 family serine peptidase n=1 Tax=Methanoculleus bourgensis TaxID=83986 RepID=UPI00069850D1|nr:S8 family serine peptidase [Methanoculleus bourgensis]
MQTLDDADLSSLDVRVIDELTGLDAVVVSVSDPDRFMEEVSQCPGVKFVERDIPVYALDVPAYVPDDRRYAEQWGPGGIGADYAWSIERGESSVIIAVIDTGVDYTHPDMGNYITGGYDWINNDDDPMDDHGHGTHCAGIAAAVSNNALGVAGISQSGIMAEKVLDFKGSGTSSLTAAAIRHAADNGADVISMSLGAAEPSRIVEEACRYAWEKGCILVAASGNGGANLINYPAAYDIVIAVGSVGKTGLRSPFSNYGTNLELVAPGESILSTTPGNTYGLRSGTSMACPHVAGVAALLLSRYPGMSNLEVRKRLTETADDLGSPGKDPQYGYGLVNVFAALGGGEAVPPTIESDAEAIVRGENITLTLTGEGYREYRLSINDTGLTDPGMYPMVVPDQQGILPGEISGSAGFDETACRVIMPESGTARVRYATGFSTVAQPFTVTVTDPKDPSLSDTINVSVNPGTVTITAGDRARFFFGEEVTLSGINTDNESTWLYMTGPGLDAGGAGLADPGMVRVPVTGDGNWSFVWDTGALEGVLENGTYTLYAVSGPKAADELEGFASATASLELLNSGWPAPAITGISPDMVFAGDGSATVLITGSGFFDGATVLLEREGYRDVIATEVRGNDTNTVSATLDLTAARTGGWDVVVRNADGKTALLPGAFTIWVKGDLNNNDLVDIGDAALVAYMVVGNVPEDLLADFNQNGVVDIGDAAKVAYVVVGRISEL